MTELAEGARLESVCTPKAYRGFESPLLRHIKIGYAESQKILVDSAFFIVGTMKKSPFVLLPYIALVLSMLLLGSSFVAQKLAYHVYDPIVVLSGRMGIASLCFFPFLPAFLKKVRYREGDLKWILFMVLCQPCLYFIFEAKALLFTTASQAGMVTATLPIFVAIGAMVFLKEKVGIRTFAGFLLAMAGVGGLSLTGDLTGKAPNPMLGNFFELMAMICATGYTLVVKRLSERYSPFFLTAIQAFCGTFFFFPALFLPQTGLPVALEVLPAFSILYLGAAVTLGAYGLYAFGVSRIPASQASAYINLMPVFAIFFSWLILKEQFFLLQYGFALLVFLGVAISQQKGEKNKICVLAHSQCPGASKQ